LISFLYPAKSGNDAISCKGQAIALPAGSYTAVHVLAASSGQAAAAGTFTVRGTAGTPSSQQVSVASWNMEPVGGRVGFAAPYRLVNGAVDAEHPSILGDYTLPLDPSKKITEIVLPNDPRIKVFALTLER
jgi:hypothetical protein